MLEFSKEKEKRRFNRVGLRASLRYQIRGSHEFNNAVSGDIGVGGLGFVIDKYIAPSSNLSLQINVLSRILNPIGRVTWIRPLPRSDRYHLGLEFVEFDPGEKKYLSDYVDMHSGKI